MSWPLCHCYNIRKRWLQERKDVRVVCYYFNAVFVTAENLSSVNITLPHMHLYDFHLLWQLCRIWTPIRQKNTFTNSREKARGRSIWFVPICKIHYSYLSVFSTRPECFTFSSGPPIRVPPSPPPTDEKMPFSIRAISLKRWMQILQLTKIMALKTEHSEIGLGSISSRCSVM